VASLRGREVGVRAERARILECRIALPSRWKFFLQFIRPQSRSYAHATAQKLELQNLNLVVLEFAIDISESVLYTSQPQAKDSNPICAKEIVMPSARTIKVLLAVAALTGLVIVVGAAVKSGTTAAPQTPIIRQILRKKDLRKLAASASEIAELRRKVQEKEKRDLKTREFKDMPVKIHAIRNVDSETWYKDLQIEIKNIGAKPIYFILAYLEFPDHQPGGRDTGITLTFGDKKNWDIQVPADPQDQHLDPGQTYVLMIPEKARKGLGGEHERVPQQFKKLDFHMDIINFGDRTGFETGRPLDLRNTKPRMVPPKSITARKSRIRPYVLPHKMVVVLAVHILHNLP
jgi:hypothetical protein